MIKVVSKPIACVTGLRRFNVSRP